LRTGRPLDEVEEIVFGVAEEQYIAATAGGFDGVIEGNASRFQFDFRPFDGIHLQGEVAPAGEGIDGGFLKRHVALINLEHQTAGQGEEKCGRRLAVVEDEFRVQGSHVPIFQRDRVLGGEAEVFDGEVHERKYSKGSQADEHLQRGRFMIQGTVLLELSLLKSGSGRLDARGYLR
jgi:hypothetical protein